MSCSTRESVDGRHLKVLVAYSMSSTFATTTLEYLLALKRYTNFDVSYVHATHDAEIDVDFDEFDVVFQNYCVRLCFEGYASPSYQQRLKKFRGLKVLAVQDDYDRTSTLHRGIRDLGFHMLVTCIPQEFWPLVYPVSELPGVHIVQGLTGYMPETLTGVRHRSPSLSKRRTVIGYRGRDIGAKYGRLGFDKFEIGRRMIEICTARGIAHDIAMDEASRIYGDAWYEFLGSCRVVLGSESASNVFDFDGSIERTHDELRDQLGRPPTYEEFRPYIDHVERQFDVGQISPRVFECAVMRTPMVLFRGRYSDVIEPDVHYIALEKDFSNVDEVLLRIEDIPSLEVMADSAYQRLVSSGLYGYRAFAAKMKAEIEAQHELRAARAPLDSKVEVRSMSGGGDGVATELPVRSIVLAERPTAKPKSLSDFQRKHERLALEYYVEKFPELQSFYSSMVPACAEEVSRLAADYTAAAELGGQTAASSEDILVRVQEPVAVTDLFLRRSEIEEKLSSVASQVDALRRLQKAARLKKDDAALEAGLERELEILKHYFVVGPQLYQQYSNAYQRTRNQLIDGARELRVWNDLRGSSAAKALGLTDASAQSLKKFDDWFLEFYPYVFRHIPFEELRGKHVLEIGLGYGTVAQRLAESGVHYAGLDIATGPVEMAKHRLQHIGVRGDVKQGSVLTAPFADESFDLIIAIGRLHHTGDMSRAIAECYRMLRPRGKLIAMVYYAYSYRRWVQARTETLRYFIRERLGYRGVVRSLRELGRWDHDHHSEWDATATEFVSIASLRNICAEFCTFDCARENADVESPLARWSCPGEVLKTAWPRFFSLEIYFAAIK